MLESSCQTLKKEHTSVWDNNSLTRESALLNRKDIARVLNMSESKARKILAEHGIKPIDLGPGRGNGLRWHTSAVIHIADILHAEAQAQKNRFLRHSRPKHPILGKTAAELWAEFNGNTPIAEVCNGN